MTVSAASLIRRTRHRAGVSQATLAQRMGTTQTAVARLERRGSNPRLSTLAHALQAAGARLVLTTEAAPESDLDAGQIRAHLAMAPAERAAAHDIAYSETRELVAARQRPADG